MEVHPELITLLDDLGWEGPSKQSCGFPEEEIPPRDRNGSPCPRVPALPASLPGLWTPELLGQSPVAEANSWQ